MTTRMPQVEVSRNDTSTDVWNIGSVIGIAVGVLVFVVVVTAIAVYL